MPTPMGLHGARTQQRVRALVPAAAALIGIVTLASCSSGSAPSALHAKSSTTTTVSTANAIDLVASQYVQDYDSQKAANQAFTTAVNPAIADERTQQQRIAQDDTTEQQNSYGVGCTVSVTDFSAYNSCVAGEEQAYNAAQSDATAAQGQYQEDFQTVSSNTSTYETAISVFIGQVVALSWPPKYTESVTEVLTAARAYRNDLADAAALSPSTPQATNDAIQAQSGTDVGNLNDALSVLGAKLPNDTGQTT